MREFIQFCALLFVGLGALIFIIPLGFLVNSLQTGGFAGFEMFATLAAIPTGASITLIGGGTYIACNIDANLEKIAKLAAAARLAEQQQ